MAELVCVMRSSLVEGAHGTPPAREKKAADEKIMNTGRKHQEEREL
jgi:hypothetical protein